MGKEYAKMSEKNTNDKKTGEMKKKRYNPEQKCEDLIRKLREQCGNRNISYYALAKEADVSTSTLHALMAGKTKPYMYTVYKLCNALDISIRDILDDEDMPENTTELSAKEREIISTYRKYSRSKKRMLETYMRMLEQFEENRITND